MSDLRAFVDHSRVDIMSDLNVEMLALRDELGVVRTSCVSAIKLALQLKLADVSTVDSSERKESKNGTVHEVVGSDLLQTVLTQIKKVELRVDSIEREASKRTLARMASTLVCPKPSVRT